MDVDSDSDVSIMGDIGPSRNKGKGKGKAVEKVKRKKDKSKEVMDSVSRVAHRLYGCLIIGHISKHIHGKRHIRVHGRPFKKMRRGACKARLRIGWQEVDGRGE